MSTQWVLSQSGQSAQCEGVTEAVAPEAADDRISPPAEADAGNPVATAARQARNAESRRRRFMKNTYPPALTLPRCPASTIP